WRMDSDMETKILEFLRQIPFGFRLRKQLSTTHNRPRLQITRSVMEEIRKTIGGKPAEQGGVLGGSRKDGVVRHFYFDEGAARTGITYSPNVTTINKLLIEEGNPMEINLLGFVHSHPGLRQPSKGDLEYARKILAAIPELRRLYLPIVITESDSGCYELIAFAAVREKEDVRLEELELAVIDSEENKPKENLPETFRRVRGAYDLDRLAHSRVIYVGAGGAASFIEDVARTGLGEHVLIDSDVVSESNIATQQVYRKDIGRPKVDCIAERIRDINPNANVVRIRRSLDDIEDAEFKELALKPLTHERPQATLLCGFTDNFEAQARVNRLSLHFGIPSLCAQVYLEGRGAEITFTYPGVTPACHRCVLSSRYNAHLEDGYKNTVTSDGTPIFATTRLNALKGFIAMAMLHH